MTFLFLSNSPKFLGTFRIFFDSLPKALEQLGHTVVVNPGTLPDQVDVIIVTPEQDLVGLADQYRKALIGSLKPQSYLNSRFEGKKNVIDFLIAGSRFESDQFLTMGKEIVVLRHIDSVIPEVRRNLLASDSKIILGYHGNLEHLEQMGGRVAHALEKIGDQYDIVLRAVYNLEKFGVWKRGRPNIPISDEQWSHTALADMLSVADIGLVPNSVVPKNFKRLKRALNNRLLSGQWLGAQDSDVFSRMKITSNAGRAFVFAQYGIPVVGCPIPELLETLVPAKAAIPVSSGEAWYRALQSLLNNPRTRSDMGNNGLAWARENLSIDSEAKILTEFINNLPEKRSNR